jgi:hypothetical protein
MGWPNEELFKAELEKGLKKASKAKIDQLTSIAVQDEALVRPGRPGAPARRVPGSAAGWRRAPQLAGAPAGPLPAP